MIAAETTAGDAALNRLQRYPDRLKARLDRVLLTIATAPPQRADRERATARPAPIVGGVSRPPTLRARLETARRDFARLPAATLAEIALEARGQIQSAVRAEAAS